MASFTEEMDVCLGKQRADTHHTRAQTVFSTKRHVRFVDGEPAPYKSDSDSEGKEFDGSVARVRDSQEPDGELSKTMEDQLHMGSPQATQQAAAPRTESLGQTEETLLLSPVGDSESSVMECQASNQECWRDNVDAFFYSIRPVRPYQPDSKPRRHVWFSRKGKVKRSEVQEIEAPVFTDPADVSFQLFSEEEVVDDSSPEESATQSLRMCAIPIGIYNPELDFANDDGSRDTETGDPGVTCPLQTGISDATCPPPGDISQPGSHSPTDHLVKVQAEVHSVDVGSVARAKSLEGRGLTKTVKKRAGGSPEPAVSNRQPEPKPKAKYGVRRPPTDTRPEGQPFDPDQFTESEYDDSDLDSDYRPDSGDDGSSGEASGSGSGDEGVGVGNDADTDDGDGVQASNLDASVSEGAAGENRSIARRQRGGLATRGRSRARMQVSKDGKKNRRRHECPVEDCPAEVVDLRRHLRQCHGAEFPDWKINQLVGRKDKSRPAVEAAVEDQNDDQTPSSKRGCPICKRPFKRVDKHLKKVHHLQGDEYKSSLKRAKTLTAGLGSPNKASGEAYKEMLLRRFKTWLTSLGGSNTSESVAGNTCRQVERILDTMVQTSGGLALVPSTLCHFMSIGDKGKVLDNLQKKYQLSIGTLANYAYAASKFVDCLGHDWSLVRPWASKEDYLQIKSYVERVKSNLAKQRRDTVPEDRPNTKTEEECPTADQVDGYFLSRTYVEVAEIMEGKRAFDRNDKVQYRRVLSFLMLEICFSNAKRAGDLCNLTLWEMEDVRMVNRVFIVRVRKHKVKSKPCLIAFSPTLYGWIRHYIVSMRNGDKGDSVGNCFTNSLGGPLTPSEVVNLMNVQWNLYSDEIKEPLPRLSTSSIRKTVVSLHRKGRTTREEEADLAVHMAHDKATADQYYDLEMGRVRVAHSSKVVRRLWRSEIRRRERTGSPSQESPSLEDEGPEYENPQESGSEREDSSSEGEDIIPPSPRASSTSKRSRPPVDSPVEEEESMDVDEGRLSPLPHLTKPPKKWVRRFDKDQAKVLTTVFEKYIADRVANPSLQVKEKEVADIVAAETRFPLLKTYDVKVLKSRIYLEVSKGKKAQRARALAAGATNDDGEEDRGSGS